VRDVEVHLVTLAAEPERFALLESLLSPDERARAARLVFAEHRHHFTVCRGTLREILGRSTGVEPRALAFVQNEYGKPALPEGRLRFNVSHSAGLALIAVSAHRELGVDIERMNRRVAEERIAERFFSPNEAAKLRALPVEEQTHAFFRCWTRKEAYIKARGMGLALPLHSFDVTLGPDEPAAILRGGEGWEIESLDPAEGFAGALVASTFGR